MERVIHPVDIPMTCHVWLTHAIPQVRRAMEDAWLKHGEPTDDPVRGSTNLCEEVGEVATCALDATRTIHAPVGSVTYEGIKRLQGQSIDKMCEELAQVAGYAILLMVKLQGKQETTAK